MKALVAVLPSFFAIEGKQTTFRQSSLALLSLTLGALSLCNAANAGDITYNVDLTVGAATVTGDIVTDGTIGVLCVRDNCSDPILGWNLVLNDSTVSSCGGLRPCTFDLLNTQQDAFTDTSGTDLS